MPPGIYFDDEMPSDPSIAPSRMAPIHQRRSLQLVAIGLATAFLFSVVLVLLRQLRAGRVSLELVNYRQFTRGGTVYAEVKLTNGTEKSIGYSRVYDVEQNLFSPFIRTNLSLMWSEDDLGPQNIGVKQLNCNLAPHGTVVALQPLLRGIGPYKFGIFYRPPEPLQSTRILQKLNQILLEFAPRIASAKYLFPRDEVMVWCPTVISPPSKDLPEAVAPNFNDAN